MNYIKEAENYLRYYRDLRNSVDHASRMIAKLKWLTAPKEIHAVVNDESGVSASKPVNTVEQLYQLVRWQEQRKRTQEEIEHIELILDNISQDEGCEQYRQLLELWYVEKRDKYWIAEELSYSRRSVFNMKNRALEKFAVNLFGIDALKGI